jgi:phospholipid transport system substrate-binding protein
MSNHGGGTAPAGGPTGGVGRRRGGLLWGVLLATAMVAPAAPGAEAGAPSAMETVRTSINEVIRILEDKELKKPGKVEERRRLLEQVINERFDYEEMAKRSLGAQWHKLNDAERAEFVGLFKRMLANSYSGRIEGYSGEQVEYLGERVKQDFAEVRTKVLSGKTTVPLDYRMLLKDGGWRVYDVIIDGVSLVNNYNGQFKKILKDSSYAELLETLRKKAEEKPQDKKPDDKKSSS